MNVFSYKVEHDLGLAPNPFHGFCTLAVCKSSIRRNKNLNEGDWVVGTGSKSLNNLNRLIYAMKVEEKLPIEKYWDDPRFQSKKPIIGGSLVKMYGDNIYHQNFETKEWIQVDSAHSLDDGFTNDEHLRRDTSGEYVLISQEFYYFGENAPEIPKELREICSTSRDMEYLNKSDEVKKAFIEWLESNFEIGIHGDPINWKTHS